MAVLLKIAYRNLREHKVKTLIIGSLIAFGVVILVVGNSLLETAEQGIRRMYSDNFTGQVMIASSRSERPSLFLGPAMRSGEPTPPLQGHRELAAWLDSLPGVEKRVSQISGFATAEIDGEGRAFLQLFGVAPEEYLAMFPASVELLEGRFLRGDEAGIVLSRAVADTLEESAGRAVRPGDRILLTGLNSVSGTRLREVEVKGIMRFPSEAPNLSLISYIDLASLRVLSGMTRVTDVAARLTREERAGLGAVGEEELFSAAGGLVGAVEPAGGVLGEERLLAILGDTSQSALYRELDPDAFHYVLLGLEPGRSPQRLIRQLNRHFQDGGLPFKAYGWVEAAGGIALLVSGFKWVFNLLVLVIAVVAVIVIMNTLVISITERIGEIGTMRALGAQRPFIRLMITLETLLISLVFGSLGLLLGGGIIGVAGRTGIEAGSVFLSVLFGGPTLRPALSGGAVLASLLLVAVVGIAASLYPVSVALRIAPVRAMSQR